jgi:hypothetical protein
MSTYCKKCIDCDMIVYYDEMEPIYCDQCGNKFVLRGFTAINYGSQ